MQLDDFKIRGLGMVVGEHRVLNAISRNNSTRTAKEEFDYLTAELWDSYQRLVNHEVKHAELD